MSNLPPIIEDEALVPAYQLPPLLRLQNGEPVETAATWREARRPELLRLFEENVYGRTPPGLPQVTCEVLEGGRHSHGARRRQVRLHFGEAAGGPHLDLLLYLPESDAPCPLFLGLNFDGNHTVDADTAIAIPYGWVRDEAGMGVVNNRATEAGRGQRAQQWPVDTILERGYGLATAYYGDLAPDYSAGYDTGIRALYCGTDQASGGSWGALGTWAWGLSRALDYLASDAAIDANRVALMGHSRLGKAALWAAAQDERFALVIANESGCGGAALSRRCFGETIAHINSSFPYWFCRKFHEYNGREAELPIDQHQLLALIAPRPLYVASAAADLWADPRGEWLAVQAADPAWRLLGVEGHGASEMPAAEEPILTRLGYHIRRGEHDVTAYDWACFLDFADRYL